MEDPDFVCLQMEDLQEMMICMVCNQKHSDAEECNILLISTNPRNRCRWPWRRWWPWRRRWLPAGWLRRRRWLRPGRWLRRTGWFLLPSLAEESVHHDANRICRESASWRPVKMTVFHTAAGRIRRRLLDPPKHHKTVSRYRITQHPDCPQNALLLPEMIGVF
jgi:hypothetical protein